MSDAAMVDFKDESGARTSGYFAMIGDMRAPNISPHHVHGVT